MGDGSPPLNIARWLGKSAVNGPGERFVVWLQGCSLRCPGCWNQEMWPQHGREWMSGNALMELAQAQEGIEGVTITGGEPLEQAEALVPFLEQARSAGLSVMVFSGYELGEVGTPAVDAVLSLTDLLVAGRYREAERAEGLRWRGSANQRIHFLTGRYSEGALVKEQPVVEFHLCDDGAVALTGFPEVELLGPSAG
jgi:anaerobic ribonucleoside-triphosphate reductase activating protein